MEATAQKDGGLKRGLGEENKEVWGIDREGGVP